MTTKKKRLCGCWECRRSRGETPKMVESRVKQVGDRSFQRTISPYPLAGQREKIPPDADITGNDRPRTILNTRPRT